MKFDFYITGTIGEAYDWWTGTRGTTANDVKEFLSKHEGQELTIAVSSLGGYIDDGIAIMEYIKAHGKCNMVIIGMTASAATVLCMKAQSIKIARGSMMLIHNSSQMLDVWTSANKEKIDQIIEQFQHEREQLDTIDKCMADVYSQRNGKSVDENLEMMAKEKWLSAQDALDFGLVDAILDDDDDTIAKAKSVKAAYSGYAGAAEHYGVPQFAEEPKPGLLTRMRNAISNLSGIMADAEEVEDPQISSPINNKPNSTSMKKIVLNLVCAVLALQDFELNEENKTMLSEDQLNAIENDLKEKADKITALEGDVKTANDEKDAAVTAKAAAEQTLADLQKEFDEFKAQAGDTTQSHARSQEGNHPANAKEMYDSIKDLI